MPEAEEIRAIAEEQAGKEDLLEYLNFLPGKNGQYWMVFPFKIRIRGTELTVFIRILKREQLYSGGQSSSRFFSGDGEQIIADIASPKRQWRFFLGKTKGEFRADIRVFPAVHEKTLKVIEKKAKKFLGEGSFMNSKGFTEIAVQNGEEFPSWAEDLCSESLPSFNKEV